MTDAPQKCNICGGPLGPIPPYRKIPEPHTAWDCMIELRKRVEALEVRVTSRRGERRE